MQITEKYVTFSRLRVIIEIGFIFTKEVSQGFTAGQDGQRRIRVYHQRILKSNISHIVCKVQDTEDSIRDVHTHTHLAQSTERNKSTHRKH